MVNVKNLIQKKSLQEQGQNKEETNIGNDTRLQSWERSQKILGQRINSFEYTQYSQSSTGGLLVEVLFDMDLGPKFSKAIKSFIPICGGEIGRKILVRDITKQEFQVLKCKMIISQDKENFIYLEDNHYHVIIVDCIGEVKVYIANR